MNNNRFKFRVWDIKESKFLEKIGSNTHFIKPNCFSLGISDIILSNQKEENYIISQFTGLLDLNNKEIYEGDILNFFRIQKNNFYLHDNQFSGYVFFDISSCQYLIKRLDNDNCCLLKLELYLDGFDKKIIGNIYENPNLLLDNSKSFT